MTAASASSSTGPRAAPQVPSLIPGTPLLDLRKDPLGYFLGVFREHGDFVRMQLGPVRAFLATRPEHIKHVLVDRRQAYDKRTKGFDTLRNLVGNGLLTSEGELWRRQRRIAQPAFHRKRIAAFADTMASFTEAMLRRWEQNPRASFDMAQEMTRLTLQIASETLLGSQVRGVEDRVGDAVGYLNNLANRAVFNPLAPPLSWPTPANFRFRTAAATLETVVTDMIAQRRRSGQSGDDLLGMFMEARDEETGEGMSDQQLRDEVMTMFLAGHETTANALTWAFYLLSTHPFAMRNVAREAREVLGDRIATAEDVERLTYTTQVFKEAIRLYPPAWALPRRTIEDDVIDGYHVPRGSIVILSPYVTHRHPELWSSPEGFDPERFSSEAEKSRPRLSYFPFGAGPRLCIGQAFAMMEGALVLASVARRSRPALVPGHPVIPQPLITLRPKHGLHMYLESDSS